MKRFLPILVMAVLLTGTAAADETVYFPYWQHGQGVTTFFSVVNTHDSQSVRVTLDLGVDQVSKVIRPECCWMPDTGSWDPNEWYDGGDQYGSGMIEIESSYDCVLVWGCVYSPSTGATYTVIEPQAGTIFGVGS